MARDPLTRLEDIAREARFAIRAVAGVNLAAFTANGEKVRAVLHALNVIGEAVAHLEEAQREGLETAGVPLARVRGMRNLLTHEYWRVSETIVHEVATLHLPPLLTAVEALLLQTPPPAPAAPPLGKPTKAKPKPPAGRDDMLEDY